MNLLHVLRHVAPAVACITLAAPSSAAPNDAPDEEKPLADALTGAARTDYVVSRVLFESGDFAGALGKLEQAYGVQPDARLLMNEAACAKRLHRYASMRRLIARYVADLGARLSVAEKTEADEALSALEPLTRSLTIQVNAPGAEVFVDDERVGTSPLPGPVFVDIGSPRLRVTKSGYVDHIEVLQADRTSDSAVRIDLVPVPHVGRLDVRVGEHDALLIDGKAVSVGQWDGALPSGHHSLRVTGDDARPFDRDVLIEDDRTLTVNVTLARAVRSGGSLPAWAWVAGAVLVAGAAVGAYALLHPRDQTVVVTPPMGTIGDGSAHFQ